MRLTQKLKVATLAFALAAIAPVGFAADTIDVAFVRQVNAFKQKVSQSKLDVPIKADFDNKLGTITRDAGCAMGAGPLNCSRSSASALETAKGKVEALDKAFAEALVQDGSKKVEELYRPKLDALKQKIESAKLDGGAGRDLLLAVTTFWRNQRPTSTLSDIEKSYQALVADVDAAIKLSAESASTKSFIDQLNEKNAAITKMIADSKLNPQTKADLTGDLKTIMAGQKRSATDIAAISSKLTEFTKRLTDTIASDGAKSFAELTRPRLADLRKKLIDAKIDAEDTIKLEARIRSIGAAANDAKSHTQSVVDKFEADFKAVNAEIDAAIALNATRGKAKNLADALVTKARALVEKIKASRLSAGLVAEFNNDLKVADGRTGCVPTATPTCARASTTELAVVDGKLNDIGAAVDKAIATYGSKKMEEVYGPQLNAATEKLRASRVQERDRMRLTQQLDVMRQTLRAFDRGNSMRDVSGGRIASSAGIEAGVKAITDDIDAAIRLSAPPTKG